MASTHGVSALYSQYMILNLVVSALEVERIWILLVIRVTADKGLSLQGF